VQKEDVYNHIKKIKLPYTVIDVGWWYQISMPRLPSGKLDYLGTFTFFETLIIDGNTPSALTDVRDIGTYVAALIADPRTLNKYVLAYNEVWTFNDVYHKLEELSGEEIPRNYISEAQLKQQHQEAEEVLENDPENYAALIARTGVEYKTSWGVRGDNTPEYAKYLGYLTSKELYPDLKFRSLEIFLKELLEGKVKGVYQNNQAMSAASSEKK